MAQFHPLGEAASSELGSAIARTIPGHLIAMIGVGGAGKSTAIADACSSVYAHRSHWPPGVTPIARVMAMLPDKAYFSSLAFVASIRSAIMYPDIRWLTFPADPESKKWHSNMSDDVVRASLAITEQRRMTEAALWAHTASLARSYHTETLVVEHATALLKNHSDKTPAQHLQNLMSWGEDAGVRIILVGVETLPELWNSSVELSRRIHKIWLPPYPLFTQEDTSKFALMLKNMLSGYEADTDQLVRKARHIHAATAGIIGQVRRLFDDASHHGSRHITIDHLMKSIQHADAVNQMWNSVAIFDRSREPSTVKELLRASSIGAKKIHKP